MGRAYPDIGNSLMAKRCFMAALKINPDFDTKAGCSRPSS
jgi:hypothetical protein